MSLAELTRNCFQSGISASKWLSLVKLLVSKESTIQIHDTVGNNLCNSVLILYRSYPSDADLREYLMAAIQDGTLSIAVFVSKLLQAARSPELHAPSTLDMLCRIALDAHYASGSLPIGSVVPYDASSLAVLGTVQDALALLRIAHSLPVSHFHQLTASASQLVTLLLSCVSDMSQVTAPQAMVYFADVNDLLQNFRLSPNVRQALEAFALSLSLLMGDDAKAAREAQLLHSMQMAFGKRVSSGHSNGTDTVTFILVFNHLVAHRAQDFGSGDGAHVLALLVALFRWASWTPAIFYTQLLLSALICLSQSSSDALIWKAFILGRLLNLLPDFEAAVADSTHPSDWRRATQAAIIACLRQPDLIARCNLAVTESKHAHSISEEETPFTRDLLQKMIQVNLLDVSNATEIDPLISNDNTTRIQDEARDAGFEFESYLENKLGLDTNLEDLRPWVLRLLQDCDSHSTFAAVALRRFTSLVAAFDVESLSHMCKIFYTHDITLDVMALQIRTSELIYRALFFLEHYDCETVGDPQTAVSHLGDVVLFIQYATWRFHLDTKLTLDNKTLSSQFLASTEVVRPLEHFSADEGATFNAWTKALFDSSSEGIEDTILRSTKPKIFLRISATLFARAMRTCLQQKMDIDTLNNGVSYFTGPLLNWALVGIVKSLVNEILYLLYRGSVPPIYLDILQVLMLSPSCPRPVLLLCGPRVLSLFTERKGKPKFSAANFNISAVRNAVVQAYGMRKGSLPISASVDPKRAIQTAFAQARAGKAPALDIQRCINAMPPTKFLQVLWSELSIATAMGETETCRRIATFVMTMPRGSNSPPLLPIFLHIVVTPLLTAMLDSAHEHQQTSAEHGMNVELIVTIISSVLTFALHLELAMHSVTKEHRSVLGEVSSGMARKLAIALRANKSSRTSQAITQSLAASQSFVANFPMFVNELG